MEANRLYYPDGRWMPCSCVSSPWILPLSFSEISNDMEGLPFWLVIPLMVWFTIAIFVVGYELHQIIINLGVRKML